MKHAARLSACRLLCLVFLAVHALPAQAADDILLADFEGETYGDWKAEGEAFGPGPAPGTMPNQMPVSGFEGKRLVNSFYRGDGSTGTLTSPPFKIERKFLNFLIGGGAHAGETCMNLLVDGKVFRTATGPNEQPGGSEQLDWHSWDLTELAGREATIQIVDRHTGGWGHINVDYIVQSDRRKGREPARRTITVEKRYLHLPVKTGARKVRMKLLVDCREVRQFDVELAAGDPEFWVFADVGRWKGQSLTIDAGSLVDGDKTLAQIVQSDDLPDAGRLYAEKHRPQFHFTSRRGWLNDPNGLVYHDGWWHLFYQHNPYGWNWGNMHWGHAVSRDLFHWRELPAALHPWSDAVGACFSGSAVVDTDNTAGFKNSAEDVLVAAFTDTGAGESIAYSNDGGHSWTLFEGNPVVKHPGRDPKVVWHEPTKRWVMAVYDETDNSRNISFYSSPNLKEWRLESRIDDFFECPDLFELPIDGEASNSKWVLYAADGKYVLGDFDGREFKPGTDKLQLWHGNFYAAQTYSNAPNGRRIQIGWGRGIEFPGMPFNQQMTVPVELTLRTTGDGVRMFAEPVREIETLYARQLTLDERPIPNGEQPLKDLGGELLDIDAELEIGTAKSCGLIVRGQTVAFHADSQQLQCGVKAPLKPENGRVRLRILADRGSIEVFAGNGRLALSHGVLLSPEDHSIHLFARDGEARLRRMSVRTLNSVW